MKNFTKITLTIIMIVFGFSVAKAQVAINTDGTAPDGSAMLDIVSTSKGMLIPRMTKVQRDLISPVATGLLIYQTDEIPGFYFYNGTWEVVGSGAMSINDLTDGKTVGNSVFLGSGAGTDNKNENVAVGVSALSNNSGKNNTANGYMALFTNSSGSNNSANGHSALFSNTTGNNNTANGYGANLHNKEGSNNTIIGFEAGMGGSGPANKSGNVCLGYQSGYSGTTGSNNVFLGYQAGYNETGSNKLYIENSNSDEPLIYGEFDNNMLRFNGDVELANGGSASSLMFYEPGGVGKNFTKFQSQAQGDNITYTLPAADGSSGEVLQTDGSGTLSWVNGGASEINDLSDGKTGGGSVFLGSGAGANDDGTNNQNVAVGCEALSTNTTGQYNTANGYMALFTNSTGDYNTANGYLSLNSNTGSNNTAIGTYSLYSNMDGNENSAIGRATLYSNTTGIANIAFGYYSLFWNIDGTSNNAFGNRALGSNTNGNYNIGVGNEANFYNQEGSYNTIIGYQAGMGTSNHNKSGNIFMGYQAGYTETGSNKLYIENSNSSSPLIYGEFDNDKVTINDVLKLAPRAEAPLNPTEGEIYVNSTDDHHIYCYLNGSWVQLDNN